MDLNSVESVTIHLIDPENYGFHINIGRFRLLCTSHSNPPFVGAMRVPSKMPPFISAIPKTMDFTLIFVVFLLFWGPFPPNEVGRIAQHFRKREGRKEGNGGVMRIKDKRTDGS